METSKIEEFLRKIKENQRNVGGAGRHGISVELRHGAVQLAGFRRGNYKKHSIPQGNQGNVQFGGFGVETSFGVEIGFPSQYSPVLSSGVEH